VGIETDVTSGEFSGLCWREYFPSSLLSSLAQYFKLPLFDVLSLLVSLEEVYAVKNLAAVRKFAYQCIVLSMVFLVSPVGSVSECCSTG
jgi:hypothetical protein